MTAPLLEVEGLSYRIGGRPILSGICLELRDAEYVSVIGPNGAGKSTLLKCINRILTGGSGRVRLRGRDLRGCTQAQIARLLAYVPQADGRALPFTVRDFVMMGRYPHLSPFSSVTAGDREAVGRALAATGTAAFADRLIATLSGGERQKVLIAAALAQEARALLLDEPATFLDPRHQDEIFGILEKVNHESGVAILAVTHDINVASLAGDRIVALRDGRVVYSGPARDIMSAGTLRGLYGKDFLFVTHPVTGTPVVVPGPVRRSGGRRGPEKGAG